MPAYAWLANEPVDAALTPRKLQLMRKLGVPYSQQEIDQAAHDVQDKTEMEALIAYLQGLGVASKGWH
jgi:cytochrome c oxidase cbb3-type subunit 2